MPRRGNSNRIHILTIQGENFVAKRVLLPPYKRRTDWREKLARLRIGALRKFLNCDMRSVFGHEIPLPIVFCILCPWRFGLWAGGAEGWGAGAGAEVGELARSRRTDFEEPSREGRDTGVLGDVVRAVRGSDSAP